MGETARYKIFSHHDIFPVWKTYNFHVKSFLLTLFEASQLSRPTSCVCFWFLLKNIESVIFYSKKYWSTQNDLQISEMNHFSSHRFDKTVIKSHTLIYLAAVLRTDRGFQWIWFRCYKNKRVLNKIWLGKESPS